MNIISMSALLLIPVAGAGWASEGRVDPDLGRNLAATCAACHGTDGRSAGGNARLAGESRDTLLKTLKQFKSGEKPSTLMHQLTKGYSDAQLEAVATYLSAQK